MIDAPPSPLSPPAPTPAAASSPAKPQQREIQVSQMAAPARTCPRRKKKGSAKDKLFSDLRSKAVNEPTPSNEPEPAKEPPKAALPKADAKEDPSAPAPEPKVGDGPKADDPEAEGLAHGSWSEEYKAKLAAAEAKVLETEKRAIPEAKWKESNDKLSAVEKRAQRKQEEIGMSTTRKAKNSKTSIKRLMKKRGVEPCPSLGNSRWKTGEGASRPLAAQDILELVNLPLGKAHELAQERFGDLAPEVMAHRKEIRKLFDEQAAALDDARKAGAEREKTQTEKQQREYGEVSKEIKETWSKANDEVTTDPNYGKFFTPVDGDEQGNQRLAKGFELADRAFSENPLAPGLTTEQRQAIVKRHAAVRNRCAAFGPAGLSASAEGRPNRRTANAA